jgi:hypothetical protein
VTVTAMAGQLAGQLAGQSAGQLAGQSAGQQEGRGKAQRMAACRHARHSRRPLKDREGGRRW